MSSNFTERKDVETLETALRRKVMSIETLSNKSWRLKYYAPLINNSPVHRIPSVIIIIGVEHFIYMKDLICKAKLLIIVSFIEKEKYFRNIDKRYVKII